MALQRAHRASSLLQLLWELPAILAICRGRVGPACSLIRSLPKTFLHQGMTFEHACKLASIAAEALFSGSMRSSSGGAGQAQGAVGGEAQPGGGRQGAEE